MIWCGRQPSALYTSHHARWRRRLSLQCQKNTDQTRTNDTYADITASVTMEQDWVIFITGIIFCSIGIILTLMVLVFNIRFMRLRWVKILFKISAFGTKMFSYLITLFNLYTFVCYRNNMKIKFDKNSANMMRGFSDHLSLYFLLCCHQVKVKTCVILQRKRIVRKVCRKRSVAARCTWLFRDEGLVWPKKVGTGNNISCLMETNSQVFL